MARVLVIDDDEMQRTLLERMLDSVGFTVDCAEDGIAGLKLFNANTPDLVLTDISMPGLDGHEVIAAIRTNRADIPIIAISGGGGSVAKDELLAKAAKLGAGEIIMKPFEFNQLVGAVKRALKGEILG